ncbi:MAG TPA: 8-amino-7-oxononanoate synthase [Casimicrobiaceae bacterium]|jgi:8-amino-7-oxononanoate synthase|nr:8-amino-7-oxononanoate synthase [Casimicrobiaceae bacterium]
MSRLISELDDALEARAERGLRRRRRTVDSAQGARLRVDGREVLHFGSNDYLGLAGDPRVVAAAQAGAARYGVGAGASHLISGHFAPHEAIERELAAWIAPCGKARALLFSTGYLANLAIVTALVGRGDAVFADKLNHACLNDAALLSRADFVRHAHGDLEALEQRLASSVAKRKLIATDAVFSMDGDIAALGSLLQLAEKYDAWLTVDDAHGFGVLGEESAAGLGNSGRGTLAQLGLVSERIVYMATLGKAAGVAGAFVAAHDSVIETLIQTARSYIFTTAAPPMLSCALAASLALIRDEPERRTHLFALIDRWRELASALPWQSLPSATAIQPLILGANADALNISDALWKRDIWVPAIRPPTVPQGSARLRITFSASHTLDDVDRLADALADVAG